MTALGTKLAKAAGAGIPPAPAASVSVLGKLARRGENVVLPLLGAARIELVGARDHQEIEASTLREMAKREIERSYITETAFELERAVRTLAVAVRDPVDGDKAFGTIDEWLALDADVISACWSVYGDVRERLNPIATPLTEEEALLIESGFKKKDAPFLRSFGIAKLCGWLLSSGVQLPTSPTPSSSTPVLSSES